MNPRTKSSAPIIKALGIALASTAALAVTNTFAQSAAPAPEHSLATKVSVYSEYEYRGITQTSEKPALQLNLDYAHSSGFYLGTFLTNIKWLLVIAYRFEKETEGNFSRKNA